MRAINPLTGQTLAEYPNDTPKSLEDKLAAAHEAQKSWRQLTFAQRAEPLLKLADMLEAEVEQHAALMTAEMGKPIKEARGEAKKCAWVCRYYAQHAEAFMAPQPIETDAVHSAVRFDPLGAVLGIMPWNFPFWQVLRFAAPALMAGNVALLKHAPNVPGCALAIGGLFERAGFPAGTFTVLMVEVDAVEAIIHDPRVHGVALTGSERAGRAVAAQAGAALKPVVLELGGSDPFVVLADADLDRAVAAVTLSRMLNNGQSCIAAKRIIVEDAVHDAFVQRLQTAIEALRVGDPAQDTTDIGPMARRDLLDALHGQVERSLAQGAQCLVGGKAPADGCLYPPTLLVGLDATMAAFKEETFGPVAAVARVKDAQEAIALANQTDYGLGAAIWTSPERGAALAPQIQAGNVTINGFVKSDPRLPFGGIKNSGMGRELGPWGLMEFVNVKTVWVGR